MDSGCSDRLKKMKIEYTRQVERLPFETPQRALHIRDTGPIIINILIIIHKLLV